MRSAAEEFTEWYEEETGMNTEGYRKLFPPTTGGNRAQRRGQRPPKRMTKSQRSDENGVADLT